MSEITLTLILLLIMMTPPIHEGLHNMACEIQGGTVKDTTLISTICIEPAEWDHNNREMFFAMPYKAPLYFLTVIMFFLRLDSKWRSKK